MPSTSGGFGLGAQKQCTAMSKRSGERCKGIAVATSPGQKCRMHGGMGGHSIGPKCASFNSGRYSKYLPAQLDELYREAKSNPELLEMSDHIALLEARMQEILGTFSSDGAVPKWSDVAAAFAEVETALLSGDTDKVVSGMEEMHLILDNGVKWDKTWAQVTDIMEQLRRMTETEVRRKKELNQMVPIERVIILMAAVGTAVKRHVTNPAEIDAVYRELAMLHGSNQTFNGMQRVGPEIVDVGMSVSQIKEKNRGAAD